MNDASKGKKREREEFHKEDGDRECEKDGQSRYREE